jgi:hypothetical protein
MEESNTGVLLVVAVFAMAWIINIAKFFNCDFDAPYKEEVIHFLGIIIAPGSIITAWF